MNSETLVVAVLAAAWLGAGFCVGMIVSGTMGQRPPLIHYEYAVSPWHGDPVPTPAWVGRA
jgi:hypothetical protein